MEQEGLTVEELTKLFSVLSHDLKSPIFSVDGFSELLITDYADRLDEEGQDFLRRIRSSVQQMKKVLDEEVLLKYNYMIEDGGVKVDVPADLPTVDVDPEKMREAIGALISNALFFNDGAKGKREIAVACSSNGDGTKLCVRDNGIGIDPRYTGQIFDLGLKLDKARGGGPGYGLYLARKVAEGHGGTVTVESSLGEGSTFCLTLPT